MHCVQLRNMVAETLNLVYTIHVPSQLQEQHYFRLKVWLVTCTLQCSVRKCLKYIVVTEWLVVQSSNFRNV